VFRRAGNIFLRVWDTQAVARARHRAALLQVAAFISKAHPL